MISIGFVLFEYLKYYSIAFSIIWILPASSENCIHDKT
nr:MAG TPA: hypothetical protein [Caudoviricetes sp.]